MSYAKGTSVSAQKSRYEIEGYLSKAGATTFAFATDQSKAAIMFTLDRRNVRLEMPFPPLAKFARDHNNSMRPQVEQLKRQDDEVRRLWRCLALSIKAKLASIEEGISTVDREFMPDLVTSDGRRLEQAFAAELGESRRIGRPLMLVAAVETEIRSAQ